MNRGRLFATIEHIERGLERPKRAPPLLAGRALPPPVVANGYRQPLAPTPRARAEQLFRPRETLTASPTALATAAKRAKSTRLPAPPAKDPKGAVRLAAKALKVTLALDPAEVGQIERPDGKPAPPFVIEAGGRKVQAQVSAKGLRKVLATIAEHGVDRVAVILQGKLAVGDKIEEAGLVAQVKQPKVTQ